MTQSPEYSEYLGNQIFIAFDTETTGMWAPINRVVEIAAVKFTLNLGVIDTYESLVNPNRPIPEEVIEIHGITDKDVAGAPTAPAVLDEFNRFCGDDSILIAHNAPFDISFIGNELKRHDITFGDNPIIDTVEISKTFFPNLESYSLLNLARHFGIAQTQDHRALSDSKYVYLLFRKSANKFASIDSFDKLSRTMSIHRMSDAVTDKVVLPARYSDLTFALEKQLRVEIDYYHPTRGSHIRTVRPKEVHQLGSVYYLIAFCEYAGAERTFRLDRVKELRVLAG